MPVKNALAPFLVATLVTVSAAGRAAPSKPNNSSVSSLSSDSSAPVRLQPPPRAKGKIQAFPRVAPGPGVSAPVAARINAALARDEALVAKAARECNTDARQSRGAIAPAEAWERVVQVTMRGPRFLAYTATDSYDCGGAYPNDGLQTQLVYDLATGKPVDWLAFFPKGKGARGVLSTAPDGAKTGLVVWPELARRAEAAAEGDCKGEFSEIEHSFGITLVGKTGALVAKPADLPHATQACAEDVTIPTADLRRLGFSSELTAALEAAR